MYNYFKNFVNISFFKKKMGMALDIRIEEKAESEIERLNSLVNLFKIPLLTYFKIFVGILLGPTTFRRLRDKSLFLNSVLFILLF